MLYYLDVFWLCVKSIHSPYLVTHIVNSLKHKDSRFSKQNLNSVGFMAHQKGYMKIRLYFHSALGQTPANCALVGSRFCVEVCHLFGFHQVEGIKE